MTRSRPLRNLTRSVGTAARRHRFSEVVSPFLEELYDRRGKTSALRVLDVGGTLGYWEEVAQLVPVELDVTTINPGNGSCYGSVTLDFVTVRGIHGHADSLPEAEFDLIYSNSVIEHIGDAARRRFAQTIRARRVPYLVQTPNRYFPVEPHYVFPLLQFASPGARAAIGMFWHHGPRLVPYSEARAHADGIDLLGRSQLMQLFPDARLVPELVGPLVKSWMVLGGVTLPPLG